MRKLLILLGAVVATLSLRQSGGDDDPTAANSRPASGATPTVATPARRSATAGTDRADGRGDREIDLTAAEAGTGRGAASGSADEGHHASSPTEIPASGWTDVAKRTLAEVKADNVPMMAAAVAFAGLLALFPAIIAAMSIYGLVTDPATAAQAASDITAALPSDAASLITDQMQSVADSGEAALGTALIISVLGALWSASGGMGMLVKAINRAYDEEDERGFVKNKALALGLTLGAIIFFAVAVTLIAVVPAVIDGIGLGVVGTIAAQIARWVLLAGLIAVALAVLFRYAPDRDDAEWRWISPGATVAAVLWLVASLLFSVFVNNFGSYNETYGAIAGVVVLMLWLQISALVVLLGAELNAETERQTVHDTTTGADEPMGQRGAAPADEKPPELQSTASRTGDRESARA